MAILAAARRRKLQKKILHSGASVSCAPKRSITGLGRNRLTNQTLKTKAAAISSKEPKRDIRFGSRAAGSLRGFQVSRASSLTPLLSAIAKARVVKNAK